MADNTQSEQLEKRAPDTPEEDPIADRSMSGPLLIFSLLLMITLLWSLYDEVLGQRPWKQYQKDFVSLYSDKLDEIRRPQATAEKQVKESPEYQALEQQRKAAEDQAMPRVKEIDARVKQIDTQVDDITPPFQDARSWMAAKNYQLETTESQSGKNSLRNAIAKKREEQIRITIHNESGGEEKRDISYAKLEELYNNLRDEKARLLTERVQITQPEQAARKKRDDYLQNNLTGLTAQQVDSLKNKVENFRYDIKQLNVANGQVVDRCESCHLGAREPVTLTVKDMDGERAFVSHPNKDLLKIHDPERFGCSTCHGGNGRGTTSEDKAHGRYEHWLWPLYYKENTQAGCVQCHSHDRVIQGADVFNRGRNLFQSRGCVGCHRYEGYDREYDALSNARQSMKTLELDKEARLNEVRGIAEQATTVSDEQAVELLRRRDALRQTIAQIEARIDEFDIQSRYLMQDQKKVGPNLKEIRAKLRKEWIPVWLADPQAFRPGTKMPTFRFGNEEIEAISAFLWQSALDVKLPAQPAGDAGHGKELFKTLGCMACHSMNGNAIDMGNGAIGGDFAANLARVGEKANYEYIVRWVHNPRQRLAPYAPSMKKDLLPADYAQKGLPFVFDDEHSKNPLDGRELQVQNMTVMPNFRLSDQDARDIATFLMAQKRMEPEYPGAPYMDDASLVEKGELLVRRYGCAGCHEIKGMEDEQRIGTELTVEGSKPIERLDFALLQRDAEENLDPFSGKEIDREDRERWYDHKGFFENKLRSPGIYDRGKEKAPEDRLRMPNIYLPESDVTALTTFLLGSVETNLPASMRYTPEGQKKAVQDGWWVIQKYNCMGCHNVLIGQDSVLMGLPMYQGDAKEQLPPRLTSEGARVNPAWLLGFLKDPSLTQPGERASLQQSSGKLTAQGLMAHLQGAPGAGGQSNGQQSQGAQAASGSSATQQSQNAAGQSKTQQSQSGQQLQQGPQAYQGAAPLQPDAAAWQQNLQLHPQPGMNRNGVRVYLKARMPTFNFSPNELQALVNFFMGASDQHQPYIPERLEPLTGDEPTMARALFTSNASPCLKCHMTGDPAHDAKATAPNFLLAPERLKPSWTKRWIYDPQLISPGVNMPNGLFNQDPEHGRYVFNGPTPPSFQTYEKDHLDLVVRYMFQMTPEEQRRLGAGGGGAPAGATQATSTAQAAGANKKTAALLDKYKGRWGSHGPIAAVRAP
ncbi:MAG: c-type cytochrome [Blastocatellia bacterium]